MLQGKMTRHEGFENGGCMHSNFDAALKTCERRMNGEDTCRNGL